MIAVAAAAMVLAGATLGAIAANQSLIAAALLLLVPVAYTTMRWPRPVLVIVALSAIIDRYLVSGLLPASVVPTAHFASEGMLATATLVITSRAWRTRRLVLAIAHPATAFFVVFAATGVVSALLNHVPVDQAVTGLVSTLDAVLLFYLPRMVGFSPRQALLGVGAIAAIVLVAALAAILQALAGPEVFGLSALHGRFGEPFRLGSFIGDPNVFAALLSASLPFSILAVVHEENRWRRRGWLAIALILAVALWLSFSRGGWFGAIGGFGIATLIFDRRSFVVGAFVLALGVALVIVMPRSAGAQTGTGVTALGAERALPPQSGAHDLISSTQNRVRTVVSGKDLRTLFILNAVPIVKDHLLLGVGPGRYGGAAADLFGTPVYGDYGTSTLFHGSQRTVDNFWLHILVEGGLLGVVGFLGAMGAIVVSIVRSADWRSRQVRILVIGTLAATLALTLNSVTTMLLEANSVAFIFWFLLGLASIAVGSERYSRAASRDP